MTVRIGGKHDTYISGQIAKLEDRSQTNNRRDEEIEFRLHWWRDLQMELRKKNLQHIFG